MRTTEVVVGLSAIAMSIASGEQGRYGALALGLVSARFWSARFHPNPLKGVGIPARILINWQFIADLAIINRQQQVIER